MAAGARAWSWAPWRVEDAEAWVWLCALCLPVLLAEPQFPPSEIQFLTSEPRASVLTHWAPIGQELPPYGRAPHWCGPGVLLQSEAGPDPALGLVT